MAPAAGILALILLLLSIGAGIASLVCFILVVIEMFKRNETGIGIATIVLTVCTGFGTLLAFVYGWVKASEWGLKKVMVAWTILLVVNIALVAAYFVFAFALMAPEIHRQMNQMQQNQPQMERQMQDQMRQLQEDLKKAQLQAEKDAAQNQP